MSYQLVIYQKSDRLDNELPSGHGPEEAVWTTLCVTNPWPASTCYRATREAPWCVRSSVSMSSSAFHLLGPTSVKRTEQVTPVLPTSGTG